MELNEYQNKAMSTCTKTSENVCYMLFNLIGELGEFSSKIAKAIRKGQISIVDNQIVNISLNVDEYDNLMTECEKEAGDCMWQLFGLLSVFGWKAEDVAEQNLEKLASRQKRGVIIGNGDNR